jgi:cysteine-rich repeat protein
MSECFESSLTLTAEDLSGSLSIQADWDIDATFNVQFVEGIQSTVDVIAFSSVHISDLLTNELDDSVWTISVLAAPWPEPTDVDEENPDADVDEENPGVGSSVAETSTTFFNSQVAPICPLSILPFLGLLVQGQCSQTVHVELLLPFGWQVSTDADQEIELEYSPVCGDGHVQQGELCDDGNEVDDDGCTDCFPDDWNCEGDASDFICSCPAELGYSNTNPQTCEPVICGEDQYVSSHACVDCPLGFGGNGAADATGSDTECVDLDGCVDNQCGEFNDCVETSDGLSYTCNCHADLGYETAEDGQHCQVRDCGVPEHLGYAFTVVDSDTYVGGTATAVCADDLQGTAVDITCETSGQWSTPSGCYGQRCMRIITGTGSNNDGTLDVWLNTGNGFEAMPDSGTYRNFGTTVLDTCYDMIIGMQIMNPTTNAWAGSIEISLDGGTTWSTGYCTTCDVPGYTDNIICDGNADGAAQAPTDCLSGRLCDIDLYPAN